MATSSYLFCFFLLLLPLTHSTARWILGEPDPDVPSTAFGSYGGGNNAGNGVGAMREDGNNGHGGGQGNDDDCDGGAEGLVFGFPKISIPGISFGGISIPGIEIGFAGVSISGAGGPSSAPPPGCKQPYGISSKRARRAMSPEAAMSPPS